jgi:hypothetical protein
MGAVCYHLHHNITSRQNEFINEALMKAAIEQQLVRADEGLDKYIVHSNRYK